MKFRLTGAAVEGQTKVVDFAEVTARPDAPWVAIAQSADGIALSIGGANATVALDAARGYVAVALDAARAVAILEQRPTRALAAEHVA